MTTAEDTTDDQDPFEPAEGIGGGHALHLARAGPSPDSAATVVVAVHGITASHVQWRAVARDLVAREDACMLAPDLRGRGRSASLGPPYGMDTHVEDVHRLLERLDPRPVVLVGHSMGAYVVARLAEVHPDRVAAVVLIDGGLPIRHPPDLDVDLVLDALLGPAIQRLRRTFASVDEYIAFWRSHPAFAGKWDADLEAYVRYDLVGEPGAFRSVVVEDAVRADGADMLRDEATQTAAERVRCPLTIVRAPRGLQDDPNPMIPSAVLEAFAAAHPTTRVEEVPDVNHYTVVLGTHGGARRVAHAIATARR